MFTNLELITLELALHLAIKQTESLKPIDSARAEGEIHSFEQLIKKCKTQRQ